MKEFWGKYGQYLINLVVFLSIGNWVLQYTLQVWRTQGFDFVEIAFAANNVLLLVLVLTRKPHVAVDANVFHQGIALFAFFSGMMFQNVPNDQPHLLMASKAVILLSLILGIITLFNLGRSFGILIALREVKTTGLYRLVRHPMYGTDILFKLGMILKKPCWYNGLIMGLAIGCYVYRAMLEERFLSQSDQYKVYMEQVPYRFLPGVF